MDGFDAYLTRLASAEPAPGGGSAATLVGSLGAALVAMVARITASSPKHAVGADTAREIALEADTLRDAFLAARPLDEAAYGRVVAASALPRAGDVEREARTHALQAALAGAAEAPLDAAALAREGLHLAVRAAALGNAHLDSDVECAVAFFRAALTASAANVAINHRFLKDAELVRTQGERLQAIRAEAAGTEKRALALLQRT